MQYVDRSRVLPPPSLVTDNIVKENSMILGHFWRWNLSGELRLAHRVWLAYPKLRGLKTHSMNSLTGGVPFVSATIIH